MNESDSSIILMQYPDFESVHTVQQLWDQMDRIRAETVGLIPEAARHVYQLCSGQLLDTGKNLVLQHTPDFDIRQDSSFSNELKTRVWTPFVIETKQALRKMPLYQHKLEIQMSLNDSSVLILKSSTGSGKTTQLPQYLSQVRKGVIVCSQPRKLGTINVSERVKEEAGTYLSVSTVIRMEELSHDPTTGVVFITERALLNILLESVQREDWLPWMSVLILDEAHERAMDCDVILGLVKESILPNRPDFKLIVASATVDMSKLTSFLPTAVVLEFCDPLYPINIQYVSDYFSYFGAMLQILDEQVHHKLKAGESETILVFLTGMEEILQAHDHFHRVCNEEIQQGKLHLKMLHGRLTFSEQSEIVNPGLTTGLRVIFSTNVAESSVTVPAVTTVIDSCRQKTRRYNSERGVLEDKVVLISKDSAGQRAGRCGRTCPGTCIRILTLQEYEALPMCREPMILQSHLGLIILKFTKYRLRNLADFPMQDNPSYQDVLKHLGELLALGALSAEEELEITKLGHFILNLEIEPSYGKVLFASIQGGLGLVEMMSIVSIVKNGSYIFEKFDIPFIETREVVHSLVSNLVNSVFAICDPVTSDPMDTLLNAVSNSLKKIYVLVNPIVHLGDVFLYLFAYRQFELVRCQSCYFELQRNINSVGFMAVYSPDNQCANCFELKWNWCKHFEVVHGSMKFIRNSLKELSHSLKRMNVSLTDALPKESVHNEALLALLSTFTFSTVNLECHMILQRNAWKLDSLILHLRDEYSTHLQEYIGKALCSVFHSKACIFRKITGEGVNAVSFGLVSLSTKQVLLAHPSSPYVKQLMQNPQMDVSQYFLYNDIIEQERLFIKTITPIKLEWLQEVASAWLKDIEFTTQFEDFAMEEVKCVGPAIIGCFSRRNLLEIEEEMHHKGAPMALILLDFTNFALKVWAPRIVLHIAVALVNERVKTAVSRLIETSRYHQSFRKSAVLLVMKAGAIVVNVSSLHNSVKYSLKGLRNYANTYQLNKELSVLFPYQLATLSPKLMSYGKQATVYFSSESEAEKAQQILRKSPLPGLNSLITSLIPSTNSTINADFAIKIHLPNDVPDGKIKAVLDMFGEVGNFFIYRNPTCTKAIVRFTKTNSAKFMLSNYRKISQELFGAQWSTRIELVDDGIPIPKALVHMDKDNLMMEIERISQEFNTHIHFQDGGHPRLYVKSKTGTVPNDLVEKIVFLLREETISAPAYIIDELMDRSRYMCDGHLVDWYKWRNWLKVDIMVHAGKAALSVIGLPLNRRLALDEISAKVVEISQSTTRRELTFRSSFEMRSFLDGKVRLLRENNVKWVINQRNNSVFLEGRKQAVESILSKEPSRIFRSKLEKSCQLCYSPLSVETRTVLDLCGHQYHSECLQDQIKAQISESPFPDLPLKCAECGVPLTQKDWYSVLDVSDVEALYTASLIYFINTNPKFCWCETANCNFVYNLDDFKKQNIRKCPQCKMIWCLRCHRLVLSLAHDLQCEKGWEDEDNRKNRLWLLEFTKSCPRCKFRIEKNKGCNHMKCPKCFQDFCFICDSRLTSNPMEHYSVPGTLCFQKMMVDIE